MSSRILFTLKQAWRYRSQLRAFHSRSIPSLQDLNFHHHQQAGIKVLVLDFDGVLAPHGNIEPQSHIIPILKKAAETFGEENVFILTNKPLPQRQIYFQQHFPSIEFITGFPKKPFPEGMNSIIEKSGRYPHEILFIDDRLLTGALVASITGVKIQYLKTPLVDYENRPFIERLFQGLRIIERMLFPPQQHKEDSHADQNPRR